MMVRAKCAPQFMRLVHRLAPDSPVLNYETRCPCGVQYCRITPDGQVTPCPYMPVVAGDLRRSSFADLWRGAPVFADLRDPRLGGRCGVCEFSKICGGCRCRAYATYGDYLAEDPACAYQPGAHGGQVIELPEAMTFGLPVARQLTWQPDARARVDAIPAFARGMVVKAVEAYARSRGEAVVTAALLAEARSRWGSRVRPRASPSPT
jgi:radical SAM protein with 4Fe4S-binding SPASM domain